VHDAVEVTVTLMEQCLVESHDGLKAEALLADGIADLVSKVRLGRAVGVAGATAKANGAEAIIATKTLNLRFMMVSPSSNGRGWTGGTVRRRLFLWPALTGNSSERVKQLPGRIVRLQPPSM